jgi:tetratricopeptide (TPR) repeat protein
VLCPIDGSGETVAVVNGAYVAVNGAARGWAKTKAFWVIQGQQLVLISDSGFPNDVPHRCEVLERHIVLSMRGAQEKSPALLGEAIQWFEDLLATYTPARRLKWARTKRHMGEALFELGKQKASTELLASAAAAYQDADEVTQPADSLFDWVATVGGKALVLAVLGQNKKDTSLLFSAVEACQRILSIVTREENPIEWATAQYNLGNVLVHIAEDTNRVEELRQAIAAYCESLREYTQEDRCRQWANCQCNLGTTLLLFAERTGSTAHFNGAAVAYRAACRVISEDDASGEWSMIQENLAYIKQQLNSR